MKTISLFFVRWAHKYAFPKYCGLVPAFQFLAGSMAFFYVLNYPNISKFTSYVMYSRPRLNRELVELLFIFNAWFKPLFVYHK